MDDKLTIFIGVTAAAVVLQMLILAGMFVILLRLSARVRSVMQGSIVFALTLTLPGSTSAKTGTSPA